MTNKNKIPVVKKSNNKLPPMENDPLKSFKEFMEEGQNVGDITDTFLLGELEKEAKKKKNKKLRKKLESFIGKEKAEGGYIKKYAKGGGVRKARY
jgi:hypothetical protein